MFGVSCVRFLPIFLLVGTHCILEAQPASKKTTNRRVSEQRRESEVGNFVGNVGVSTAETLSQTTRIAINIISLNIPRALTNVGDIVTGRGVDRYMIEFMEHLPTILENDLHLKYKATSADAVGNYITGQNLGQQGAAALLSYIIEDKKKEGQDPRETLATLKEAVAKIREGGGKTSAQLGKELSASMERAIDRSPKPLPIPIVRQIIGDSPVKDSRILAIAQEFSLDLLDTQSLPYLRAEIAPILKSAEDSGINIRGLDDQMLVLAREESLRNLQLRECLRAATTMGLMQDCISRLDVQKNRAIGSTLQAWSPHLRSGRINIEYNSNLIDKKVNVGPHILAALAANRQSHNELMRTGSTASLNRIGDDLGKRVLVEVSDEVIRENAAKHFSASAEQQKNVEHNAGILRDRFLQKINIATGDQDIVQEVRGMVSGVDDPAPNNALDQKIRKPLEETLREPESKLALLAIALEKAPFTKEAKARMLAEYETAVKNKKGFRITFDTDLPAEFQSFLVGFDNLVHNTSFVPDDTSAIAYVRDLLDPNSKTINTRVMQMGSGSRDLFNYYLNCDSSDPLCESLENPYRKYISWVKEANSSLKGTALEQECKEKFPMIVDDVFNKIWVYEKNVAMTNPMELMKALEGRNSQQAINCFVAGQAIMRGLTPEHGQRLHVALEKSSDEHADLRSKVVNDLHDYLNPQGASERERAASQKALLGNLEILGKEVVRDFSHDYVDQFAQSGTSPVNRLLGDDANSAVVKGIVDRMIDNTDVLDEDTDMDFESYARYIANSPLKANSAVDQSLQKSLDQTLIDERTRRDILGLTMGLHSELPRNGLIGPDLEKEIVEAYERADLTQNPPRFSSDTRAGVRSFLSSFDASVSQLSSKRRDDESVLQFLQRVGDPESRVVDELIAEQNTGVKDLVMDLIQDPQACLGDQGNWIRVDPKTKATEVLVRAPFAHVLDFLKIGMRTSLDRTMTATCRAAIPSFIEKVVSQPSTPGSQSVLKDPTIFLDALKESGNQTALNCITANYMEAKLFGPLRGSAVGYEAGARSVLADLRTGVSRDSGLFHVSGEKVFEALEKRNSNSVLLDQKSDMVDALKNVIKSDGRQNRHNMSVAARDLSRSVVLGVVTDSDFAYGAINGNTFPEPLRTWARGHAMPNSLVSCIDNFYTRSTLPWAMYAGEEVRGVLGNMFTPWIDNAHDSPRRPASAAAGAVGTVTPSGPEACVAHSTFFSARTAPSRSASSSSARPGMWVGGYGHSFRQWQDLQRADGARTLRPAAETLALSQARDIQVAINHSQIGANIVSGSSGFVDKTIAGLVTVGSNVPEGARAANHLRKVAAFPVNQMIRDLEQYQRDPSSRNLDTIRKHLSKHCFDEVRFWAPGVRPSAPVLDESKVSH